MDTMSLGNMYLALKQYIEDNDIIISDLEVTQKGTRTTYTFRLLAHTYEMEVISGHATLTRDNDTESMHLFPTISEFKTELPNIFPVKYFARLTSERMKHVFVEHFKKQGITIPEKNCKSGVDDYKGHRLDYIDADVEFLDIFDVSSFTLWGANRDWKAWNATIDIKFKTDRSDERITFESETKFSEWLEVTYPEQDPNPFPKNTKSYGSNMYPTTEVLFQAIREYLTTNLIFIPRMVDYPNSHFEFHFNGQLQNNVTSIQVRGGERKYMLQALMRVFSDGRGSAEEDNIVTLSKFNDIIAAWLKPIHAIDDLTLTSMKDAIIDRLRQLNVQLAPNDIVEEAANSTQPLPQLNIVLGDKVRMEGNPTFLTVVVDTSKRAAGFLSRNATNSVKPYMFRNLADLRARLPSIILQR